MSALGGVISGGVGFWVGVGSALSARQRVGVELLGHVWVVWAGVGFALSAGRICLCQ